MGHRYRNTLLSALVLLLLTVSSGLLADEPTPAGTVAIETTSVAAGVGVNWGDGVLTLADGRQYPFDVKGLEVGAVGVSKVSAQGKVYHIENLSDFSGRYVAGKADITVGGGAGVVALRNQHGVVIHLYTMQQGVKLSIAAEGVEIALKS